MASSPLTLLSFHAGTLFTLATLSSLTSTKQFALFSFLYQSSVFLIHAYPNQSEMFYDAAGTSNHALNVILSLLLRSFRRPDSPQSSSQGQEQEQEQQPSSSTTTTGGALAGTSASASILSAAPITSFDAHLFRSQMNTVLVVVWATRLFTFLVSRITRDGKDSRFDSIKRGGFLSFALPFTIQSLWAYLVDLPVILINLHSGTQGAKPLLSSSSSSTGAAASSSPNEAFYSLSLADAFNPDIINPLDMLGWGLFAVGFGLEFVADVQKSAFRSIPQNHDAFIQSGVWRYSRHPNHFGEILLWTGITLSCANGFNLRANPFNVVGYLSPLFTALIVAGVSGVPMLEKAGMKKWGSNPEYLHFIAHTSTLIPWFPAPPFVGKKAT